MREALRVFTAAELPALCEGAGFIDVVVATEDGPGQPGIRRMTMP